MKVSVCIATYNGEKFIKNQLDSILPQLSENDEIIISDDGSTDNTTSIILTYNDPRIKLFENNSPDKQRYKHVIYRVTKNFENALCNASGDIIFLSDQDDIWEKSKVKEVLNLFFSEKINLLVHDAFIMNGNNQIVGKSYFHLLKSKPGFLNNLIRNSYLGCCMVFDKNLLKVSLPFPRNLIAHDIWLGLIAESTGSVLFTDKKLIYFHRHDGNVTTSGSKSNHSFLFKIRYRLQFLGQYLRRIIIIKLSVKLP